jgi:ribose transport system substrate-binding protein
LKGGAVLFVLALVATAAALAPVSLGASQASSKPVRIAYFEFAAANTYTQASVAYMQREAKKLGNVQITLFDGQANADHQATQMQDAIAKGGYDGWVIYQLGPASWRFATQAAAKGVKIVGSLVPFGPNPAKNTLQIPHQLALTYLDHNQLGKDLGTLVIKACGTHNPCKVEYLYGYKALPFSSVIRNAFNATIKSHSAIQVVASGDGHYLADPSYSFTQNVISAHPDLNVVVTGGSQMTLGAERAVNASSLKGKVKLIGSYGSVLGVQAVCQGRWFGETVSLPGTEGQVAVEDIVAAARGKPLPYGPTPNLIKLFSPVGRIITKANCAKFHPQWAG